MSIRNNNTNALISRFNIIDCEAIYVGGKRLKDLLAELAAEDALEQQEIDELRNLLTYLDTTALTVPWIINNTNINSVLRTDINNNSSSITTLNTKTQYLTSVQGSNTAPRTASTFNVTIGDREKRQLYLTTGANFISSINDSTNQATAGNYSDNQINIAAQNGMITSIAHLNRIESIDKIEITGFGGMGIQSSPNIIIGNKGAQIKIGSEDTPEVGSTNTIIQIGKRSITRNTETQLRGNIKIVDSRFDELTTSPALTWTNLIALIPTNGLPLWVASAILTSVIPNYVYSDLWAMKGTVTKDGDVETITTPKMKGYTVYDSTVDIDLLPKVQTFLAKGDISETTLLGNIRQQVFNGEILLRNNNIVATNINWALTDAMDKVNALKLSNNDVELIAGAGANNSQLRISNTTTGGKIRLRMGNDGLQANAHDALAIYNDQASSQVLIAGSNVPSGYDTSSKLLVDHQNLTHGIKVTKAAETLITRINHNNINAPSLTLQSNWTGTTTNTLYLNASNQLMYNGSTVGGGGTVGATGAGAIFILNNPSNTTNTVPSLTMTTTYTSTPSTFIRRDTFNHSTVYGMGQFKSTYIESNSNAILQGTYEANLYGFLSSNQASSLFCKLYHIAERALITDYIIDKSASYSVNNNTTYYQSMKTKAFIIPTNEATFQINNFVVNQLTVAAGMGGGEPLTLRASLRNAAGTILGTAVDINFGGGPVITQDYTFNFNQTINITNTTNILFQVDIIDSMFGMAQIRQLTSRGQNDINYKVQGIFKNCIYDGTNDKTTLTANQTQLYSILLPLPANSYDITEFTGYSKIQLEPFFIQTATGSTAGHYFLLYAGDGTLSHLHSSINLSGSTGGGGSSSVSTITDMTLTGIATEGLRKPYFHGRTWNSPVFNAGFVLQHFDIFGTPSGEIIVVATRNGGASAPLFFSGNSGTIWDGYLGVQRGWISVCGSITGDRIYALCNPVNLASFNQIWRVDNGDFGAITQVNAPAEFSSNNLELIQIRCSHEAKYLLITEAGRPNANLCRIFKSNDFGATWTTQNLSTLLGYTFGCAMSSDGKIQYVCVDGTSGGTRADTGSGGIYRSNDFGDTWTRISSPLGGQIKRIACDGTGRFVMLADIASARVSRDYGATFIDTGISLTRSCYVSNGGQFMLFGRSNGSIYLSRNYGLVFNTTNQSPSGGFPAGLSWDTAFLNEDASIMVAGNIASSRLAICQETETNVRGLVAGTGITLTESSGNFTINSTAGSNTWTNDIKVNNGATSVIQLNPTLTNPLDINNYVYEVLIETNLTGSSFHFCLSFNEVFTNIVFGGAENRHAHTGQYSRYLNSDTVVSAGDIFITSNASFYCEGAGDLQIWGFIRPHRSTLNAANGTGNQNLGVIFHGQAWYHSRDNFSSNTSALNRMSHWNFHKYVYATPLINRVSNPTGTFNNINYISLNSSGTAVIRNLRLRTRVHSPIDRN